MNVPWHIEIVCKQAGSLNVRMSQVLRIKNIKKFLTNDQYCLILNYKSYRRASISGSIYCFVRYMDHVKVLKWAHLATILN